MVQKVWRHGFHCITGLLGAGNESIEQFRTSRFRNVSPLFWRVPILLWASVVTFWSLAFFWGPTEKFLLYMTHWGLVFIVVESLFGIAVAAKNPQGQSPACVLLASMVVLPLTLDIPFGYWFIYLTHWGFLLIVLTEGFSTAVSAYAYFIKPIDATFGLPWYVKTYWVLYNISIPVAFLVTVFYWGILKTSPNTVNYAPNPILDVMLHGVNSAVMLVELVCSAHPSRLLHVMQPLYFAGAYMLFTVIYYFAGGIDPWGNPFVYPVVDWSKPEQTMVVITLTALFLALMHVLTVGIATARDAIANRCSKHNTGIYNDGFVA